MCTVCTSQNKSSSNHCEICGQKRVEILNCNSNASGSHCEDSNQALGSVKKRLVENTSQMSETAQVDDTCIIHDDDDDVDKQNINGKLVFDITSGNVNPSEPHIVAEISNWKCKRCTLLNPSHKHSCLVCETPRMTNLPSLQDVDLMYETQKQSDTSINTGTTSSIHNISTNMPKKIFSSVKTFFEKSFESMTSPVQPINRTEDLKESPDVISDEWQCPSCSFNCNPNWTNKCQQCEKVNSKHMTSSPIAIDQEKVTYVHRTNNNSLIHSQSTQKCLSSSWECDQCTFHNSSDTEHCSMCGVLCSNSDSWHCQKCTFCNKSTSSVCSMCKETRKGPVTSSTLSPCTQKSSVKCIINGRPNSTPSFHRQESSWVEYVRQIEERDACNLREKIILQCTIVSFLQL